MNVLQKIWNKLGHERRKVRWKSYSNKQIFSEIYHLRLWKNEESDSGPGSTIANTQEICHHLPDVLKELDIRSIVDLACGDFNWLKEVDLASVKYLGFDIVEELVLKNRKRYGSPTVQFESADIINTGIPQHDLIICRDVMVHLNEAENLKLLANIKRSNSTYALLTHFPTESNKDISTGSWRTLNLEEAPYHLPPPERSIQEYPDPSLTEYPQKYLGLWKIKKMNIHEK